MPKRILLIVEGEADEVKFLRILFQKCYRSAEYKVYSYKTNVHVLAQELYNNYPDFEADEIDIKLVLSSLEPNEEKKKILRENYSDIYMIFDFEPQHDHPHFDTVKRMVNYFSDSTIMGKLYINYPMMQSYKHFERLPDDAFMDKTIERNLVTDYKRIVGEKSKFTDLNSYDYKIFYSLAVHHLKKANFILSGEYKLPSLKQYWDFDYGQLYDNQIAFLNAENKVWILNTCIFALIDFAPKKYFDFVSKRASELYI